MVTTVKLATLFLVDVVVMDVNNYPCVACEYIAYTLLGISNRSDDCIGLVYFLHKVKEKNGQS